MASVLWPAAGTHSADFQKCPGWESRRFSFGSFSSISMRTVKLGLSLRSKAQQAERISCRGQWWLIISVHGSTVQSRKLSEHWDVCEPRQILLTEGLATVRIQECPVLGMFTAAPQLWAQA